MTNDCVTIEGIQYLPIHIVAKQFDRAVKTIRNKISSGKLQGAYVKTDLGILVAPEKLIIATKWKS